MLKIECYTIEILENMNFNVFICHLDLNIGCICYNIQKYKTYFRWYLYTDNILNNEILGFPFEANHENPVRTTSYFQLVTNNIMHLTM